MKMDNIESVQASEKEILNHNNMPFKFKTNPLQKSLNESIEFTKNKASTALKGESKSSHQLIFEMNEFYFEMVDKLRELRGIHNTVYGADSDDSDSNESEVLSLAAREKLDPNTKKQLDKIAQLDEEIEETYKEWKIEKMERQTIQNDLCDLLQNSDVCFDKTSEVFLNLCKLESDKKQTAVLVIENQDQVKATVQNKKHIEKEFSTNFISKNIARVKNKSMATYCLTDEEKIKLESLLSDVDEVDIDKFTQKKNAKNEENEGMQNSFETEAYGFDDDEKSTMDFLEAKLMELSDLESVSASAISICKSNTDKLFEEIEQDEREGKFWKHENRLKLIEQELTLLKLQRNREESASIIEENNEEKFNEDFDIIDFVEELEKRKQRLENEESDSATGEDT